MSEQHSAKQEFNAGVSHPHEPNFKEWLERKQLSPKSVAIYLHYLNKLPYPIPNQSNIDSFLNNYTTSAARGFVSNYLKYLTRNPEESELGEKQILRLKNIELPKRTGRARVRIPKVVSRENVHLIVKEFKEQKYKLMVLLTYYSGLRMGELLTLRTSSFNWQEWKKENNIKELNELPEYALKDGEAIVYGKGNKEDLAIVPGFVMFQVGKWLNEYYLPKFVSGEFTKESPIFDVKPRYWQKKLSKASLAAIDTHVNPHLLRHSIATELLKNGMDIRVIQEFLRHTDISSTQVYTHVSKSHLKKSYSQVLDLGLDNQK